MSSPKPQILGRDAVARHPDLSLFQKVLLLTDGSVTEMLSVYHGGRPIRARKLGQWLHDDAPPAALLPPPSELEGTTVAPPTHIPWLERRIVLEAGPPEDAQPLVYATSAYRLDGLSPATRHGLLHTDTPIGALWQAERCEMHREIIDLRLHADAEVAGLLGLPVDSLLASRQYRLWQGGRAMGWIQEQFALRAFHPSGVRFRGAGWLGWVWAATYGQRCYKVRSPVFGYGADTRSVTSWASQTPFTTRLECPQRS